jgi:uncharacterized repeat protein (TIGR03803 family)
MAHMRYRSGLGLVGRTVVALVFISLSSAGWAQTYKVLHAFNPDNGDGYFPQAGVILDAQGNIYGTATKGGLETCPGDGCGIVFQLTPNPDGTWNENPIHEFNGSDGDSPEPLIFDTNGDLVGVTGDGGINNQGTIFKLTPNGGDWIETTLHRFTRGWDGVGNPGAVLNIDPHGQIFGSTIQGGTYGHGVVFALVVPNLGEIALYEFKGGADGDGPIGSLSFDADGNIYGATANGGTGSFGTVFKLTSNRYGIGWKKTILYAFSNQDRIQPSGGLIFDAAGNLYGTTAFGGARGAGAVYKLAPQPDGTWTPTLLYSFAGNPDGYTPFAELTWDSAGNLYGTTNGGGPHIFGTVYKLTPSPAGGWTETILYGFTGGSDGGAPEDGVVLDGAGNIYGTTPFGGLVPRGYGGVVFEITP